MARMIEDVAHATAFLSRLPVPSRLFGRSALDFNRQAWAFPVVGAMLGLLAGSMGWLAFSIGLPAAAAAVIALSGLALMTGALHEDGLADVADGFWGSRDPQRRRTIMRDSAIGTYGVLTLVLVVALRIATLTPLLLLGGRGILAFAAAIAAGKLTLVAAWTLAAPAPPMIEDAKGPSLATRFGRPDRRALAWSAAATAPIAVVAVLTLGIGAVASAGCVAILTGFAMVHLARAKIGGFSGDTLGATALLAETAFLVALVAATSA